MSIDLSSFHLEQLIHQDVPFDKVVDVLKDWHGPMSEKLVHQIGEYFRPTRARVEGRPTNRRLSLTAESLIMAFYFYYCGEGHANPLSAICEEMGWRCYVDKHTGRERCTKFEETRARFNKRKLKGAIALYRHLENSFNASRDEIVEAIRLRHDEMPRDYFDNYILPKI